MRKDYFKKNWEYKRLNKHEEKKMNTLLVSSSL